MTMAPGLRKFALIVHLVVSVGWIGAVVAYLALGVATLTAQETETLRAAYLAMDTIGWYALVPLALAALLTGLVMSLGTPWGLFRHYWTIITLALTIFCTAILLLHMTDVDRLANLARVANSTQLRALGGDLFHATGGLLVLLVITVLNVYKPRGVTPYGWRKQQERRVASRSGARTTDDGALIRPTQPVGREEVRQ
jgi:hypothetical protein